MTNIRDRRARQAAKAARDAKALDDIAALLRGEGPPPVTEEDEEGPEIMIRDIADLVGQSGRATEPYEPGEDPADECYDADGQPLPYGRCDTCGAPCSAGGCTADPGHETALS
jgi:hypothetical protein